MTEKEILQAKHRQEEAEARKKVKARKARTRRLIQEGAILEKAFPSAQSMELEELQIVLEKNLRAAAPIPFSAECSGSRRTEAEAEALHGGD